MRRQIGTVIQDGKLFQGSIYENIAICAPGLTMDEAWEAAEMAGIANDIRAMPMGMHTLISEGAGGVSGGHIIEDGTYDELLAKNGFFAELVARQRVE